MISITITALLLATLSVSAFAVAPAQPAASTPLTNYVDADGDGVCDNLANCVDEDGDGICDIHGTDCNFVDADGDGICDNRGSRKGFVDADGDGVCDNRASRNCNRSGNAKGFGSRRMACK